MAKQSGITVRCVSCKAKKTLTIDQARALTGPPICDTPMCYMPMVVVSATALLK